jgi:hypothetical protein
MARMNRSLFQQLNALSDEISQGAVKSAATKAAEGPTPADPGTYTGASSHPTAHVDNSVQKAETGARASEYESDIKKQQGALAVDNTPEMSQEGRQDEVQLNIGTNTAATGEDPAAEKDFKGTKDDPGTSHPAKTNDGEKYSSVTFKEARDRAAALGNDILASLLSAGTKQAEMPAALAAALHEKKKSPAEEKKEHGELKGDQHKLDVNDNGKIEGSDLAALRAGKSAADAAFAAGYELAKELGLSKEAAEASVREICANTLRETDEMADLFIGFVSAKQAAADMGDEAEEGEDHGAGGDEDSGASAAPADAGGGSPAGLEGLMGGGEAVGAGGGDMGAGPAAGGAPSEDEAVQELAMALEELGIPPEALIQAMQQGGGGGAGGAPAPAGAGPEMAPEMAPKMASANELSTIGTAVVNFKRSGKFQVKEARTKRSRQLRDVMKQHVLELINR